MAKRLAVAAKSSSRPPRHNIRSPDSKTFYAAKACPARNTRFSSRGCSWFSSSSECSDDDTTSDSTSDDGEMWTQRKHSDESKRSKLKTNTDDAGGQSSPKNEASGDECVKVEHVKKEDDDKEEEDLDDEDAEVDQTSWKVSNDAIHCDDGETRSANKPMNGGSCRNHQGHKASKRKRLREFSPGSINDNTSDEKNCNQSLSVEAYYTSRKKNDDDDDVEEDLAENDFDGIFASKLNVHNKGIGRHERKSTAEESNEELDENRLILPLMNYNKKNKRISDSVGLRKRRSNYRCQRSELLTDVIRLLLDELDDSRCDCDPRNERIDSNRGDHKPKTSEMNPNTHLLVARNILANSKCSSGSHKAFYTQLRSHQLLPEFFTPYNRFCCCSVMNRKRRGSCFHHS